MRCDNTIADKQTVAVNVRRLSESAPQPKPSVSRAHLRCHNPPPTTSWFVSSRRKTLAIRVSHTGVEVRAPHRVSLREIERFVRSRREWIEHHQQRLAQLPSPESLQKQYQPGELFQYRGENYPLRIQKGARAGVSCADGQLQVTLGPRQSADSSAVVKRLLEQWYRDRALAELSERSPSDGSPNRPETRHDSRAPYPQQMGSLHCTGATCSTTG